MRNHRWIVLLLMLPGAALRATEGDPIATFDAYIRDLEANAKPCLPDLRVTSEAQVDGVLKWSANNWHPDKAPQTLTAYGEGPFARSGRRAWNLIEGERYTEAAEQIEWGMSFANLSPAYRARLEQQIAMLRRWATLDVVPPTEYRTYFVELHGAKWWSAGPFTLSRLWRSEAHSAVDRQWVICDLLKHGQQHDARAIALAVIPSLPGAPRADSDRARIELGTIAFEAGDLSTAEQYWRLVATPGGTALDRHAAMFNLGLLEKESQRYHDAVAQFEKLIRDKPNDRDSGSSIMSPYRNYTHRACIEIATCYESLGEYEAALHHYRLSKTTYPLQSWCGTGRNSERWRYRKHVTYLAARAYGPETAVALLVLGGLWWYRRRKATVTPSAPDHT